MAAKYYKKLYPQTEVVLANESRVRFEAPEKVVGYFGTEEEYIHNEFSRFQREQRYGISEISWEEYERDYVKKKQSNPSSSNWREEMSKSTRAERTVDPVARLGSGSVQTALAVTSESDIRRNNSTNLAPTAGAPAPLMGNGTAMAGPSEVPGGTPVPKKPFIANIGKRKPFKK